MLTLHCRTLSKIAMVGSWGYEAELLKEIDSAHLPTYFGGSYEGDPFTPFEFDTSEGGLLHCPDCVKMVDTAVKVES
jgi:hypothetical protein